MVGTLVHQLTDGVCPAELEKAGLGPYYTDHGWDVYPQSAAGVPFTAGYSCTWFLQRLSVHYYRSYCNWCRLCRRFC